jgi:hypothetical protein
MDKYKYSIQFGKGSNASVDTREYSPFQHGDFEAPNDDEAKAMLINELLPPLAQAAVGNGYEFRQGLDLWNKGTKSNLIHDNSRHRLS